MLYGVFKMNFSSISRVGCQATSRCLSKVQNFLKMLSTLFKLLFTLIDSFVRWFLDFTKDLSQTLELLRQLWHRKLEPVAVNYINKLWSSRFGFIVRLSVCISSSYLLYILSMIQRKQIVLKDVKSGRQVQVDSKFIVRSSKSRLKLSNGIGFAYRESGYHQDTSRVIVNVCDGNQCPSSMDQCLQVSVDLPGYGESYKFRSDAQWTSRSKRFGMQNVSTSSALLAVHIETVTMMIMHVQKQNPNSRVELRGQDYCGFVCLKVASDLDCVDSVQIHASSFPTNDDWWTTSECVGLINRINVCRFIESLFKFKLSGQHLGWSDQYPFRDNALVQMLFGERCKPALDKSTDSIFRMIQRFTNKRPSSVAESIASTSTWMSMAVSTPVSNITKSTSRWWPSYTNARNKQFLSTAMVDSLDEEEFKHHQQSTTKTVHVTGLAKDDPRSQWWSNNILNNNQ